MLVARIEESKRVMGFSLARMHERYEQSHLEDVRWKAAPLLYMVGLDSPNLMLTSFWGGVGQG
jgi:hypothetical protein